MHRKVTGKSPENSSSVRAENSAFWIGLVRRSPAGVRPEKGGECKDLDLPIDLEIKSQLNMLKAEVNGEGVGDEDPDIDLEDDEIAGDVATSDAAAVTEIIRDAEASIHLDPLPSDKANLGRVSIAKVSSQNIL